jgi:hypothetical protein
MMVLLKVPQLLVIELDKIDVFYFCKGIMKCFRLRLGRIEEELRDLQRHFPSINAALKLRRNDFTDAVRQNMLAAYDFLDAIVRMELASSATRGWRFCCS